MEPLLITSYLDTVRKYYYYEMIIQDFGFSKLVLPDASKKNAFLLGKFKEGKGWMIIQFYTLEGGESRHKVLLETGDANMETILNFLMDRIDPLKMGQYLGKY